MTSLNAFDITDQRYAKPWCLWTPLTRVKTGVKGIDMFDLAFGRDQMHGKLIGYLIPPLTCVKGGVKVKITFALFFVKDQMYRQSHKHFWHTFDARQSMDQSYDHIWPRLLIKIKFRVNPIFRAVLPILQMSIKTEKDSEWREQFLHWHLTAFQGGQ